MTLSQRVTAEEAAVVFRRAAELEAAGVRGEGTGELDARALEDIGREVGLSPASVRVAVSELRDGLLDPAPAVTWGTVSSGRAVPGSPDVVAALDDEARRNLLGVVRRLGDTTAWSRSPGAHAAVARSLRGRRHHPLLALDELRATVVELPSRPGLVRVRLEGSLVFPWRLLSSRAKALSTLGVAGGALLALGADPAQFPEWQFVLAGALVTGSGTGIGLRSYRRAVVEAESVLDRMLDRLAHGSGAPAPAIAPAPA